jgi:hypothetical protein
MSEINHQMALLAEAKQECIDRICQEIEDSAVDEKTFRYFAGFFNEIAIKHGMELKVIKKRGPRTKTEPETQ